MKKSKIQVGSMIMGIIVALAIIVSQGFSFCDVGSGKTEVKTEQSEQTSEKPSANLGTFVISSSSLPSTSHVHLTQEVVLLFEIVFEEINLKNWFHVPHLPLNQFFRILLGATIAPNAP